MKFRVVINGRVYERDTIDAEEAARETARRLWRDDPPGEGDTVTAHVVEVRAGRMRRP